MRSLRRHLVALPCKLAPGMFSGEREFEVELANGQLYRSIAPRFFCWNDKGKLVAEDEPTAEIDGMVAARIVDELEDGQVIVAIPDGQVIAVNADRVKERPTEIQPPEFRPHVPVGS